MLTASAAGWSLRSYGHKISCGKFHSEHGRTPTAPFPYTSRARGDRRRALQSSRDPLARDASRVHSANSHATTRHCCSSRPGAAGFQKKKTIPVNASRSVSELGPAAAASCSFRTQFSESCTRMQKKARSRGWLARRATRFARAEPSEPRHLIATTEQKNGRWTEAVGVDAGGRAAGHGRKRLLHVGLVRGICAPGFCLERPDARRQHPSFMAELLERCDGSLRWGLVDPSAGSCAGDKRTCFRARPVRCLWWSCCVLGTERAREGCI